MTSSRLGYALFLSIAVVATTPMALRAQAVEPIRFTQDYEASDLRVFFIEHAVLADEHWHVSGSCEGAPQGAKVYSAATVQQAQIRVAFTDLWIYADRSICIMNPGEASAAFWKVYRK